MPCTERVKRDMPEFWANLPPQEQVDIDMELHTEIHELLRSAYPKQDIHLIMDKMPTNEFAALVKAALANVRTHRARKGRGKANVRKEEDDDEVTVTEQEKVTA